MNIIKVFFILGIFHPLALLAEAPFFCEKTSYVQGSFLYAVGISENKSESIAREEAFANAKKEITNYFQREVQLNRVVTERNFSEKRGKKVYVCRLVKVDLKSINYSKFLFSYQNNIGSGSRFGKMTIFTKPTDAQVYVDGKLIGRSNMSLSSVAPGKYKLSVIKNGYHSYNEEILVNDDSQFSINLKKKKVRVRIDTNTQDSILYINGFKKGEGKESYDVYLPVETENHIKMEAPQYHRAERKLSITADQKTVEMLLNLNPKPGRVSLTSSPAGAQVILDGKDIGQSPLQISLQAGHHDIEIKKDGFLTDEFSFELMPGEDKVLNIIELEAITDAEAKRVSTGTSFHLGVFSPANPLKSYSSNMVGFYTGITQRLNEVVALSATLGISGGNDDASNSVSQTESSIALKYFYKEEVYIEVEYGRSDVDLESSAGNNLANEELGFTGLSWGYMTSPLNSLNSGVRASIGYRKYADANASLQGDSGFNILFDYFWNW